MGLLGFLIGMHRGFMEVVLGLVMWGLPVNGLGVSCVAGLRLTFTPSDSFAFRFSKVDVTIHE